MVVDLCDKHTKCRVSSLLTGKKGQFKKEIRTFVAMMTNFGFDPLG